MASSALVVEWTFETHDLAGKKAYEFKAENAKIAMENARKQTNINDIGKVPDYHSKGKVLFHDARTGKYRLEMEYVSKWYKGTSDSISVRCQRAFDGELFECLSRSTPGLCDRRGGDARLGGCPLGGTCGRADRL